MDKIDKILLAITLLLLICAFLVGHGAEACEKDNSFGCKPFVTCMPVLGGWNYIKKNSK